MLMINGTLTNYVKTMQMQQKAQRRAFGMEEKTKENEHKETELERQVKQMQEDLQRQQEAAKLGGVITKLSTGQELTDKDLDILREKNPVLYQKALNLRRERKEYAERLRRCRTRDEVQRMNTQRTMSFAGELTARASTPGGGNAVGGDDLGMRMAGLRDEHMRFLGSRRYAELPWEHEVKQRKKKAAAAEKKRRGLSTQA